MYNNIIMDNRKILSASLILVAILTIIRINNVYAFKSEEELLNSTRQEVEKHLDDTQKVRVEPVKASSREPVVSEAQNGSPRIVEEIKASAIPATQDKPIEKAESSASEQTQQQTPESSEQAESKPQEQAAQSQSYEQIQSQSSDHAKPGVPMVENSSDEEKMVFAAAPQESTEFVEGRGGLPSDLTPVDVKDVNKPVAEQISFSAKDQKTEIKKALEEPVLKKMDVSKIGASPYYETYEGLRLLKYFTVAQRVEIYQEPKPIDSYILDAHAMRYLYNNTPWDIKSDYRTQLVPTFTRAYGTEITISDPKNKEGQIRYTLDYRDIYKNYWPKYPDIKRESWDQNEVLFMHSKKIEPINWFYTSNLGYRFSTMQCKSDAPFYSYYEIRSTYFGSLSIAPTDKIEYFAQGEYYKSNHVKCSWDYNPDHFLGRGEIRIKSNDYKTMYVPQFSYSKDLYYPFANSFEKYEIAFRVGRDFSKRFSAASTIQYVYSFRDEPDNTAPTYAAKNPIKDKAEYISLQNRFSYNVYDRLHLQAGLDIANGLNWSIFDNVGLLGGIEYYAPGMIRVDVGYRGNYYYNLDDWLSSIYFKFYLFM